MRSSTSRVTTHAIHECFPAGVNANPAGLEGVLLPAFYKAAAASELPLFPSRHGGVPVSLRSAVFLLQGFFRVHLPLAYKAEERLAEATETIRYVGRGTMKRCGQWCSLGCVRQARVSTKYCGPSMRRNSEGEDIPAPDGSSLVHGSGASNPCFDEFFRHDGRPVYRQLG